MPRKPRIVLHIERNADGSRWSAWRCDGEGLHAWGYTPGEAFDAWKLRADAQRAVAVAQAMLELREEGQPLH